MIDAGESAAFLAPYAVMLLDALRPSSDVLQTPTTFLPRDWQFSTFGTVLSDTRFLNWLKTSVIVACACRVACWCTKSEARWQKSRDYDTSESGRIACSRAENKRQSQKSRNSDESFAIARQILAWRSIQAEEFGGRQSGSRDRSGYKEQKHRGSG